jgi:hypothetical protein
MIRSHIFPDSGTAYDASQTDDTIRDGDVLLVPNEGRAAVLVQAWPTSALGMTDPGPFHTLADHTDWLHFDGGKYHDSAVVAIALATAENLRAAGLPTITGAFPQMLDIARGRGWSDDT